MSLVTPFGFCIALAYGGTLVTTIIMFMSRFRYFWVGGVVMALLLLAAWIELLILFMLDRKSWAEMVKERSAQEIAATRHEYIWEFIERLMITIALTGVVALCGAVLPFIIPIWIAQIFYERFLFVFFCVLRKKFRRTI